MLLDEAVDHRHYNINSAELLLHLSRFPPELKEPQLTRIKVGDTLTDAIAWYGTPTIANQPGFAREHEIFFFPIGPPAIPEWEYTSPSEWAVRFVGTTAGLRNTPFAERCEKLINSFSANEWFALLQTKKCLLGFGGVEMVYNLYVATVVSRVEQGRLVRPAPYICQH